MDNRKQANKKNRIPLPLLKTSDGFQQFAGTLNGHCVTISNTTEMQTINALGTFGKANFSRNAPRQNNILREREFRHAIMQGSEKPRKVLVVPDSDHEQNYFSSLKVRCELDKSTVAERLHLALEEAYFLANDLGCLDVGMSNESLWNACVRSDEYFVQNYIVFRHFRAKNWIVKSGLKNGADFVLYKDKPEKCHSSYVIIVDVIDASLKRRHDLCRRSMNIKNLLGLNRLCQTVGKELLICQLIWPKDVDIKTVNPEKITIKEVLMKRWKPNSNQL